MTDNDTHGTESEATDSGDDPRAEPDGGTVAGASRRHRETDYLDREVNLLNPSTPFMRDHLRVVWTGFAVWAVVVFGPVTATAVAPGVMTTRMPVLGFPLHYFLVAVGAPLGALLLSVWYARKRDQLDDKYGIEHGTAGGAGAGPADEAATTDGGQAE